MYIGRTTTHEHAVESKIVSMHNYTHEISFPRTVRIDKTYCIETVRVKCSPIHNTIHHICFNSNIIIADCWSKAQTHIHTHRQRSRQTRLVWTPVVWLRQDFKHTRRDPRHPAAWWWPMLSVLCVSVSVYRWTTPTMMPKGKRCACIPAMHRCVCMVVMVHTKMVACMLRHSIHTWTNERTNTSRSAAHRNVDDGDCQIPQYIIPRNLIEGTCAFCVCFCVRVLVWRAVCVCMHERHGHNMLYVVCTECARAHAAIALKEEFPCKLTKRTYSSEKVGATLWSMLLCRMHCHRMQCLLLCWFLVGFWKTSSNS